MDQNLATIVTGLRNIYEDGGEGNYIIFFNADPEKNCYIQFTASSRESPWLYAAAVSNNYLDPPDAINDSQIEHLQSLGWNPPGEDFTNFHREWHADSDLERQAIAQEVMRAFVEVYGCAAGRPLGVEISLDESDSGSNGWYGTGYWITWAITFVGCWIYAIASYGFLLGVGLGWLPYAIVATLVSFLWPLIATGIAILALILAYG